MAMSNKQRFFAGAILLGGGVIIASVLSGQRESAKPPVPSPATTQTAQPASQETVVLQPLVDVETEKKLLEQQRKERENLVNQQERLAEAYLATQQQAEAEAARIAAQEREALLARQQKNNPDMEPVPEMPPSQQAEAQKNQQHTTAQQAKAQAEREQAAAKKHAEQERIKQERERKAAEEKRLAAQKAEAERKKAAEAKARAEAERKRKEAEQKKQAELKARAEAERKKKEAEAKARAEAERKKAAEKAESGKKWMVQVALASTQANADSITAKLRAKGYSVTQSPTTKGVRIMVGPSKDKAAAEAVRKKITKDSSLNMKSAWVIGWVPLDQR